MQTASLLPEMVNLYEAKTNLSKIIRKVEEGKTVILARNGTPVATLQSYRPETVQSGVAKSGFFKGRYSIPNDFDTVGQEEILAMFEGETS